MSSFRHILFGCSESIDPSNSLILKRILGSSGFENLPDKTIDISNWMLPFSKFHVGTPLPRTEIHLWKTSHEMWKQSPGSLKGCCRSYLLLLRMVSGPFLLSAFAPYPNSTDCQNVLRRGCKGIFASQRAVDQSELRISAGDWPSLSLVEGFRGNLGLF